MMRFDERLGVLYALLFDDLSKQMAFILHLNYNDNTNKISLTIFGKFFP
jgi:hypothetical protein